MRKTAIAAVLCACLASCRLDDLLDDVILTSAEAQDLANNVAAAFDATMDLTDFGASIAMGQIVIEGDQYDGATAENGWTGTLQYAGDEFPGGTGDITMTFTVSGDNGPVDPFDNDLTGDAQVTIGMTLTFAGSTAEGVPLDIDADFSLTMSLDETEMGSVVINGEFKVWHGGYFIHLVGNDFTMLFDFATEQLGAVTGSIAGAVDIPSFAWDADVAVSGQGDTITAVAKVLGTTVSQVWDIADL